MKRPRRKKLAKTCLCFLLSIMLALQGTGPIFVYAKEVIENTPRDVDFSRPEALTAEEAGVDGPEDEGTDDETSETEKGSQDNAETEPSQEAVPDNTAPRGYRRSRE